MNDTKNITYRFVLPGGDSREFAVVLDTATLQYVAPADRPRPPWSRLGFCRCWICPLDESKYEDCPIAVNIAAVARAFRTFDASRSADVTVVTDEREYRKHLPLQSGLSSLIGLIMVTSGCPIMDRLRPMAHTHLPFATPRETTYRAVSMYLLAQYFLRKKGARPDWQLKNLVKIYSEVKTVNQGFSKRIASVKRGETNVDSLIRLDCFATAVTLSIVSDWWEEIEEFFRPFLEPGDD